MSDLGPDTAVRAQQLPRDRVGPSPVIGLLAVMWGVFVLEVVLPDVDWLRYGLVAHDLRAWYGVFTAPLLHASLAHIVGNSASLLVLGTLVCLHGHRAFWAVTGWAMVGGGVVAWVLTPAGTVIVGASGLVFGYFAFLVVRAVVPSGRRFLRVLLDLVIAVGVVGVYGAAMAQGILAAGPSVSWQMHLGGAIGGAAAALTLRAASRR